MEWHCPIVCCFLSLEIQTKVTNLNMITPESSFPFDFGCCKNQTLKKRRHLKSIFFIYFLVFVRKDIAGNYQCDD